MVNLLATAESKGRAKAGRLETTLFSTIFGVFGAVVGGLDVPGKTGHAASWI
jgi:hypothetical protein